MKIVLSLSSVGTSFRQKIRTYPSLVNCTTINWFFPWPEQAFDQTSEQFISQQEYLQQYNKSQLTVLLRTIHNYFTQQSENLFLQLRRKVWITPLKFLNFLEVIRLFMEKFYRENKLQIEKYETGVQKIKETEVLVQQLKEDLYVLEKALQVSKEKNEHMLQIVGEQQKLADQRKQVCEKEEKETQEQKERADQLQEECKKELNRVIPLLKEAADALSKITKDDFTQLRSYTQPPESVRLCMEAMCYVLNEDKKVPSKPVEVGSTKKYQDFWQHSKKYLLNVQLIKTVKEFKESHIQQVSQDNINKLQQLLNDKQMEKDKVFQASAAAGNLSMWLRYVRRFPAASPPLARPPFAGARVPTAPAFPPPRPRAQRRERDVRGAEDREPEARAAEEGEGRVQHCGGAAEAQEDRAGGVAAEPEGADGRVQQAPAGEGGAGGEGESVPDEAGSR